MGKKKETDWTKIGLVLLIGIIALQVLGVYDFKSIIGTQSAVPVATPTPGQLPNTTPVQTPIGTPTPIVTTPTPDSGFDPIDFEFPFTTPTPIPFISTCGLSTYPACGGSCPAGMYCMSFTQNPEPDGLVDLPNACYCINTGADCSGNAWAGYCGGDCSAGTICKSVQVGWSRECRCTTP